MKVANARFEIAYFSVSDPSESSLPSIVRNQVGMFHITKKVEFRQAGVFSLQLYWQWNTIPLE